MNLKLAANIAGGLLGLLFVFFGLNFFLGFFKDGGPPPHSNAGIFGGVMYASGYLQFVKVLEILGGVLVAIPKTRNFGLLILGPIIVNILCFNIYLDGAGGIFSLPVLAVSVLALFLLWSERNAFAALLNRQPEPLTNQSPAGDNSATEEQASS
ncbi:MAG TPA: hypothetical protein VG796_09075 [Verrucomicrobiales bacterium]|jgi:hypothetical protein|nr:hypothetical protein [Verrucomicrobiales bacterium]